MLIINIAFYREDVKNHNHALKKLNHFYENYLNIPELNDDTLNKTVVDASGKILLYYTTGSDAEANYAAVLQV